jgi:hypothetical protein
MLKPNPALVPLFVFRETTNLASTKTDLILAHHCKSDRCLLQQLPEGTMHVVFNRLLEYSTIVLQH